MTKRRAVIAALLVVALIVGYKVVDRRRAAKEASTESVADESSESRIKRAQQRRAEVAKEKRARLGGVVIDGQSREPVAGAVVSLARRSLDFGARANPGEALAPVIVTSDESGRFQIENLRAGRFSVSASAEGFLPATRDNIALDPGADESSIELVLGRGGHPLSGTISDIGGGPVGGAYVRAQRVSEGTVSTLFRAPLTARTNAEGRYSINVRDGTYYLEVGHADYVRQERATEVVGAPRTEDFSLVPGGLISGRVLVTGTDEPVANAQVTRTQQGARITGLAFGASATTGPDGRFVMSGLKSGEINLLAVARGYASQKPTSVMMGIAEHRTDVVIYVDAAYTVSGFVVAKEPPNGPIPEALVGLYNIGKRSAAVTSDPSKGDGYFEIIGVIPGSYTLGALGEGLLPNIVGATIDVVDRDIEGVIVQVSQGLTIAGRVDPPTPAYVRLEVSTESFGLTSIPRIIASQLARTTADEDGRFELTGLTTGKMTVVAEHVGHGVGRLDIDVTPPGQRDLIVKLEKTGSISGTVVDASGKPIPRVRVRAATSGGMRAIGFGSAFGDFNSAISNTDGSFTIRGLGANSYRIRARRNGQTLSWAAGSSNAETPNSPIEVELDDGEDKENLKLVVETMDEVISGRVVGLDGAPVADAWVKLGRLGSGLEEFRRRRDAETTEVDDDDADGDGVRIETDSEPRSRITPTLTDADGAFVFDGLRKGSYWVSATSPKGEANGSVRPVETGATVTIQLVAVGSASGVVSSSGAPLTDYTLIVEGPRRTRLAVQNDTGAYSIERLPAGRYEFQVQSAVGRARAGVVIEGKPVVKNFEVEPYSEITGQLVGARTRKPMSGFAVLATSEGSDNDAIGEQILTGEVPTTGEDGRFTISRQGVGTAVIIAVDGATSGFTPVASASVALEAGQPVDAGIVYGVEDPVITADSRGDLGLGLLTATWAKRPGADATPEATPPAGSAADTVFLWVESVTEGGAAAAAEIVVGDRIVSVDGIDLGETSASVGELMLGSPRNQVGNSRALVLDRGGTPVTVNITAAVPKP